jgi:hypothetical protein
VLEWGRHLVGRHYFAVIENIKEEPTCRSMLASAGIDNQEMDVDFEHAEMALVCLRIRLGYAARNR